MSPAPDYGGVGNRQWAMLKKVQMQGGVRCAE